MDTDKAKQAFEEGGWAALAGAVVGYVVHSLVTKNWHFDEHFIYFGTAFGGAKGLLWQLTGTKVAK